MHICVGVCIHVHAHTCLHTHVTIIIEEKEIISYTCMEEIGRIVSEAGWRKRRMENDVILM